LDYSFSEEVVMRLGLHVLVVVVSISIFSIQIFAQVRSLADREENMILDLVNEILDHIDDESRFGCGDIESSRFFPQSPKLAVTYRERGFSSEFWFALKTQVRIRAPSVELLSYDSAERDVFFINVLGVEYLGDNLAELVFQHSAFGFWLDFSAQGFSAIVSRQGSARTRLTSHAIFSLNNDWSAFRLITLSQGQFVRGFERNYRLISPDSSFFDEISEFVKSVELSLPERERVSPVQYDEGFENSLRIYRDNDNPDVAIVSLKQFLSDSIFLSGHYRLYLLEFFKEWRVVDSEMIGFTDVIGISACREP
jgi:hypothetical protein